MVGTTIAPIAHLLLEASAGETPLEDVRGLQTGISVVDQGLHMIEEGGIGVAALEQELLRLK